MAKGITTSIIVIIVVVVIGVAAVSLQSLQPIQFEQEPTHKNKETTGSKSTLDEPFIPEAEIQETPSTTSPTVGPGKHSENKRGFGDYDYFEDISHLPSCADKKEFFTKLPLALDDFSTIDPLGLLSPTAHTFPAPHLYFRIRSPSPESDPYKVPLIAPADVTVVEMSLIQATNRKDFADDGAIVFAPCKEFKAYFDHIVDLSPKLQKAFDEGETIRCDEYTLTYKTGPINWKLCKKKVNVKVSEGEQIGNAGGGRAQVALDFGAYDSRIEPVNFASPDRIFRAELPYNVCALDYFTPDLEHKLKAKLGGYAQKGGVITSPTCGQVIQDISGTAKGNWFFPQMDTTRSGHEPPHLALVQGHIDQNLQAFSNGESTKNSNLDTGLYYFEPKNSGFINRDFSQIKPDGNVYCYETQNTYQNNQVKAIIIQLKDKETLQIEGLKQSSCGSGTWSFSNPSVFER